MPEYSCKSILVPKHHSYEFPERTHHCPRNFQRHSSECSLQFIIKSGHTEHCYLLRTCATSCVSDADIGAESVVTPLGLQAAVITSHALVDVLTLASGLFKAGWTRVIFPESVVLERTIQLI